MSFSWNELASLKNKLAKRSDDADAQLIDHTSELLELLRGEVARLNAQVRWLEGKPLPLQALDRGRRTTRDRTHCLHQRWGRQR
ncbi:MAG: hypothetical protein GY811_15105 [Myxococcales bacterium]|nr:hypothetical protein [Myxococcales bacterium]